MELVELKEKTTLAREAAAARLHPVPQGQSGDQGSLMKRGTEVPLAVPAALPPLRHAPSSSIRATSAPSPARWPNLMIRV